MKINENGEKKILIDKVINEFMEKNNEIYNFINNKILLQNQIMKKKKIRMWQKWMIHEKKRPKNYKWFIEIKKYKYIPRTINSNNIKICNQIKKI